MTTYSLMPCVHRVAPCPRAAGHDGGKSICVQSAMLQLIQPKQRAKRADRKDLAIVRMSAQLQIISCRRVLRQLQRPVIQQDMTDIFISHQLLCRGPRSLSMGAVISADQHDIIPQEHPLIA